MTKRKLLASLVIVFSALLAGCWDSREPDDLVHALALGFDLDDKGNFKLVAQFSNPVAPAGGAAAGAGGGSADQGQRPYWVYTSHGRTPFEAIRNLAPVSTRMVDLAHVGVILLSERLARAGIGPVLQLLYREPELRLSIHWAVVEGSVEDILKAEFPAESAPAMGLLRILLVQPGVDSATVLSSIGELLRPGEEMTLVRLRSLESEESGKSGSESGGESGPGGTIPRPPMECIGGAVFKKDKMVGWIDGRAARGLGYVKETRQRGAIIVMTPGGEAFAAIDLVHERSTLRPTAHEGELRIKLDVEVEGHLEDETLSDGRAMNLRDSAVIQSLRNRFAEVIENDIQIALEQARALGSDIFGFGNGVYRRLPEVWDEVCDRWDEMFLTVPVDINVKAKLTHPGLAVSPPLSR
ncbi:MAG: Ger(x)C family spore germination protein [Firmicutes bacterium]|jgi:spore germination protein KC|nr:Ger(x)C family spore germination protein [Bacillota bacterium]